MGCLKKHASTLMLALSLVLPVLATAQSRPRFLVREAPEESTRNDTENPYRMGVFFSSVVPTTKPFSRVGGTIDADFRFQVSTAIGFHTSYFFKPQMEVGLELGYETFETRLNQSVGSTEFRIAHLRNLPLEAVYRYHLRGQSIRPYFEGGLGVAFYKMNITSTNIGQSTLADSGMSFQGRAGLGTSISWGETNELLLGVGYRQVLGSKQNYNGTIFTIDRKAMSGLIAKAELNFLF